MAYFNTSKMLALLVGLLFIPVFCNSQSNAALPITPNSFQSFAAHQPHGFIINKGQLMNDNGSPANQVFCYYRAAKVQIYVTANGITYVFHKTIKSADKTLRDSVLKINVALLNAKIEKENIEFTQSNQTPQYFYKQSNGKNRVEVFPSPSIQIKNVYSGIDWLLTVADTGLEYSFMAMPYADIAQINLNYSGVNATVDEAKSSLLLKNNLFDLKENKLVSKQQNQSVKTDFVKNKNGTIGFHLAHYNPSKPLLIDPTLAWGAIIGGYGSDNLLAVATDHLGNFYTTGYFYNGVFPLINMAGAYFQNTTGYSDVVICKFTPSLALQWSTYFGGSYNNQANGIKCDQNNDVFITGSTNSYNFPKLIGSSSYTDTVLNNGGPFTNNSSTDAFLAKFNASGVLQFSVLVGGSVNDNAFDIEIDNANNVFIGGTTNSTDFPTLAGAMQTTSNGMADGFVTKFNNAGQMLASTYFGGSGADYVYSLSADNAGNLFLLGSSNSNNGFPIQSYGSFNHTSQTNTDGFIAKLNSSFALVWSTFDGSYGFDACTSSAIDASGNLIVGGTTISPNFPLQNITGAYSDYTLNSNNSYNTSDVFLQKFSPTGTLLWGTYFGGDNNESTFQNTSFNFNYAYYYTFNDNLITDKCGNFYFSFITTSQNTALKKGGCNDYYDNNLSFTEDAFITKFNKQAQYKWGTYFGSEGYESPIAMVLDKKSNILGAGCVQNSVGFSFQSYNSSSYNYNVASNSYGNDGYLVKFNQPVFNASATYSKCSAGCTGNAQVVINSTCNNGGYKYSWSNGNTSASATGLCLGTYQVIVTDTLNSCSSDTLSFTLNPGIQAAPIVSPYSCSFKCDASAAVTIPNLSGVTCHWHINDTTITNLTSVSGLCPNKNDTLIVTSPTCGSDTFYFNIPSPPFLSVIENAFNTGNLSPCPITCGGRIQLLVSGGESQRYAFTWSNGVNGSVDSNLCPGQTYTALITDSSCFTTTHSIVMPIPTVESGTISTNTFCSTINVNAGIINGHNPVSYLWNTGATTSFLHNPPSGAYSCIVSDSCFKDTVSIVVNTTLKPLTVKLDTPRMPCNANLCLGTLNALISDGFPPYTAYWSTGFVDYTYNTISSIDSICTGDTIFITVIDACGDTAKDSIICKLKIFQNFHLNYYVSNSSCAGTCLGVAAAYTTGGNPPYSIHWDNGSTSSTRQQLCPDSIYTVFGTDGCGHRDSIKFQFPRPQSLSVSMGSSSSCKGICNGTAYAYAYGGIGPFQYTWSNGASNNNSITNACYDSIYQCKITDACGSKDSAMVFITLAPALTGYITNSVAVCNPNCNGTATINYSGGYPPYFFYWSNGNLTPTATNLCTDSVYYCILSSLGCGTDTFYVHLPTYHHMVISFPTHSSACLNSCNGTASVAVTGGLPPYHYLWNNGQTGTFATNLCHGLNKCVVIDSCNYRDSAYVNLPLFPAPTGNVSILTHACSTTICNGTAMANGSGGIAPYTYAWSNGQTGTTATNICHGANYCVITDACGRFDTVHFTMSVFNNIQNVVSAITNSCSTSICNGSATIAATGGLSPYTYLWNNGQTLATATTLCHGSNWCIVTDACGNKDTTHFTSPVFPSIQKTISSITNSCSTSICVGSATVSASGGLSPYTYLWSNGQTLATATTLCHGSNWCIVTDFCGNKDTAHFTSPIFPPIQLSISQQTDGCPNICNGTAQVAATGGFSPYTYLWNAGQTTNPTNNLCGGNNWCIATDACTNKDTITFFTPTFVFQPLHSFISTVGVSCPNVCTGSANINQTGGVPPYAYHWSNGSNTVAVNNLCAGNNYIIETDFCLNKDSIFFITPSISLLHAAIDSVSNSCVNVCDGYAAVHAITGQPPFAYHWSTGTIGHIASNLCVGTNYCIISDSCQQTDTLWINTNTVSNLLLNGFTQNNSTCIYPCNGQANVVVIGGKPPYTYHWSNGATTPNLQNLCAGNYVLTITNSYCFSDTLKAYATILANDNLSSNAVIQSNVLCHDSCNGKAVVTVVGGNAPFNYNWSNGFHGNSNQQLCAGNYFIQVVDNLGCISFDTVKITQPTAFQIDTNLISNHCFNNDGSITVTVSGGTSPYQYLWNTGSQSNAINDIGNGNYWIIVSDSNHCQIKAQYSLQGLSPHLQISHDTLVGMGQTVNLFANGAVTYWWSPATNLSCDSCANPIWNGVTNNTYCVIGTDIWHCADTACVTITTFNDCGTITMPTAFSPNGDGYNDTYKPLGLCIEKVEFKIFDRWGQLLFTSNDVKNPWDGTYKGQPMKPDVYVWYLDATNTDGKQTHAQGNVTLLR